LGLLKATPKNCNRFRETVEKVSGGSFCESAAFFGRQQHSAPSPF
jgi:hypothetical protein